MFRTSVTRKLESVSRELRSARDELSVLDEQLGQLTDEADEARLRSLVSETPQASQEHRDAAKALDAARRHRETRTKRLAKLEAKLDALLDQMGERAADGNGGAGQADAASKIDQKGTAWRPRE